MWKRVAPVYMVSPMASTCKNLYGRLHKNQPRNFAGQNRGKTAKRTRFSPKKAKTGCVLGAGGDGNG